MFLLIQKMVLSLREAGEKNIYKVVTKNWFYCSIDFGTVTHELLKNNQKN